jgi:hypothetical protein
MQYFYCVKHGKVGRKLPKLKGMVIDMSGIYKTHMVRMCKNTDELANVQVYTSKYPKGIDKLV